MANYTNIREIPIVSKIGTHKIFLAALCIFALAAASFAFPKVASADITTGLVDRWALDEGTGTTAADSGPNANPGTLTNGPAWVAGQVGPGALRFDGADDRVAVGSPSNLHNLGSTTAGFSVSAWVKPTEYTVSAMYLASKLNVSTLGWYLAVSPGANDGYQFSVDYSGANDLVVRTRDQSVAYGQWQHVLMTWDGTASTTGVRIYINGVENGSTTAAYDVLTDGEGSRVSDAPYNFNIGNNTQGSRAVLGDMDEVRVYSRVLSPSDAVELYNYAPVDSVPPVISSIASSTTQTTATITWTTNENATSTIDYGLTTSYGSASSSATLSTLTSIVLSGLTPNTLYHYRISSRDAAGNLATSSDLTFTTTGAPVAIYRSAAASSTTAISTTTASNVTLSISGATATFSAAQPNNVGVGDAIQYDSDNNGTIDSIAFIHGRTSSTVYTVKTAVGLNATSTSAADTDWSIFRAYTSLSNAEAGIENASIASALRNFDDWTAGGTAATDDVGKDLVTADQQWNIALYANGTLADTYTRLDGWTASTTQYVKIYTPYLSSEVGVSQRHSGKWDPTKYKIEMNGATALEVREDYTRVDGIQMQVTQTADVAISALVLSVGFSSGASTFISNNVIVGSNLSIATALHRGMNISTTGHNYYLWNNIVYGFNANVNGYGIYRTNGNLYAYNTLTYSNYNGIRGSTVCKNCVSFNNTGLDFTSSVGIDHSATDDGAGTSPVVPADWSAVFVDYLNNDFHLKSTDTSLRDQGVNPSDANAPFNTDIDGEVRFDSTWDIGPDEYVAVSDTTPPVISSIASSTTQTTATITWNTDEAASSTVDYGLTTSYGSASSSAALSTSTTIILSGLTSGTLYHYRISSRDSSGNLATSSDFTFTTASPSATVPTVTQQAATNVSTSTVTLNGTITSDGNASSTVRGFEYGLTTSYGATSSTSGTYGVGAFSANLTGLAPNTLYHYRAFTTNSAGTGTSTDGTFTTSALPDTTAPVISSIASSTTQTTATITWNTDESASSTVDYGLTTSYGSSSSSPTLVTNHSIVLSGLTAGTLYHFRISVRDSVGNLATSSDLTFTTAALPVTAPTVTQQAATNVSTSSVTLNGTIVSDNNGSSTVRGFEYGLTTSYGQAASTTGTFGNGTFSQNISGLTPSTLYHYRAFATNGAGTGTSTDGTFTTSAAPDTTAPIISGVASSTTQTTATVSWNTNESASSTVDYGLTTSYGSASSSATLATTHSVALSGLTANTLYHFRISVWDAVGNLATSSDQTFMTAALPVMPPAVTVQAATSISTSSATFNGTITSNNNGTSTVRGFEYGLTTSYGATSSTSGTYGTGAFSASVSGLSPNTTYHYRAFATNGAGTGTSSDQTFTTSALPVVVPTVTQQAATNVSTSTVTLNGTITSDGNASSTVRGFEYGLTTSYGATSSTSGTYGVGAFSANLTGLAPNTLYHYRAFTTNSAGTGTSTDGTFTTSALPVSAPTVTNQSPTSVSTSSVTLNGTIASDGNASSTVRGFEYGLTASYGTIASTTGTYGNGAFSLSLSGLTPSTLYYYRAFATNSAGTGTSTGGTFTTLATPDTTAPVISAVASSTGATTATITWNTNESATSTVNYGLTTSYNLASTSQSLSTSHTIVLTGLTPSTAYHFQVSSADGAGNRATSSDYVFTTFVADVTSPVIQSLAYSTDQTTATIIWTTNEASDSQVEYGTDSTYGSLTTLNSSLVTSHSVAVNGLSAATTYHFRVRSGDSSGNLATSTDGTFTTSVATVSNGGSSSGGGGWSASGGGSVSVSNPTAPVTATTTIAATSTPSVDGCPAGLICIPISVVNTPTTFTRDLKFNMKGEDVKALQKFLNANGFTISRIGAGSQGKETTLFGPATRSALIRFQKNYKIYPAVGYFGPVTKSFIETRFGVK